MSPQTRPTPRGRRFVRLLTQAICVIAVASAASQARSAPQDGQQSAASHPASAASSQRAGQAPTYGIPQVEYINQLIRQGWQEGGVVPSGPATDGEWCRRVFLDVLGRVPSVNELSSFLDDRASGKKQRLVDRLLGLGRGSSERGRATDTESSRLEEDYVNNWTVTWTNTLIGRSLQRVNPRRNMVNREGLEQYLRRSFAENKPYDKLVFELISAQGSNTSSAREGDPPFNGAVNFLTGNLEDNGVQATAKTAQIFLGLQVQCTQCHNHPFNEWKQNQFWELNAFFRQTAAAPTRDNRAKGPITNVVLRDIDFRGEGNNPAQAELYYELRNGKLQVAYPVFVDGTAISASGLVRDTDRRLELAKLVTHSDTMGKAIVNRMWAHFLGYGFTKPIDDLGPHNPPTHPELLARLADDFAKEYFDLKKLIRWITLSEPYSLSSRINSGNKQDDPTLGEKPRFSRFYLRQMRAEELYESLIVATEAEKTRGSFEQQEAAKSQWLQQFVVAFGTDENDETTTFNGTIPQALMMMSGDLIRQATSVEKGSFLERIAVEARMDNAAKINRLYLAGLARKPTRDEYNVANQLLLARRGNAAAALQDVWWAVLNSNEFILNH